MMLARLRKHADKALKQLNEIDEERCSPTSSTIADLPNPTLTGSMVPHRRDRLEELDTHTTAFKETVSEVIKLREQHLEGGQGMTPGGHLVG